MHQCWAKPRAQHTCNPHGCQCYRCYSVPAGDPPGAGPCPPQRPLCRKRAGVKGWAPPLLGLRPPLGERDPPNCSCCTWRSCGAYPQPLRPWPFPAAPPAWTAPLSTLIRAAGSLSTPIRTPKSLFITKATHHLTIESHTCSTKITCVIHGFLGKDLPLFEGSRINLDPSTSDSVLT